MISLSVIVRDYSNKCRFQQKVIKIKENIFRAGIKIGLLRFYPITISCRLGFGSEDLRKLANIRRLSMKVENTVS